MATIKFDGSACMVKDGKLYKRFDRKLLPKYVKMRKRGVEFDITLDKIKPAPDGWVACADAPDLVTGHFPGWLLVGDGPEDKFHREAFERIGLQDGTYELVGPKIQANPYGLKVHKLLPHGCVEVVVERTFEGIKSWLEENEEEGLVFHHPDGRMAKIRRSDFKIPWGR